MNHKYNLLKKIIISFVFCLIIFIPFHFSHAGEEEDTSPCAGFDKSVKGDRTYKYKCISKNQGQACRISDGKIGSTFFIRPNHPLYEHCQRTSSVIAKAKTCENDDDCFEGQTCKYGFCTDSFQIPNFLQTNDPNVVIGRIINYIAGISGSLGLIMFIYGGGLWLFSAGNPEMVKKGKNAMIWSAIGITVILSAYILVSWVLGAFGK